MDVFYGRIAEWWPVISPLEEYASEGAEIRRVLQEARPTARSLLELGSGGGHVAFHVKAGLDCLLTDLSPDMLEVSRRLNPECGHLAADMRTLDLDRRFDLVLAHDAISYMTTEADLRAAFATAYRHLKPGGLALFIPDEVLETFEPGVAEAFGGDSPDGRSARAMEWVCEREADGTAMVHYAFLLREADGQMSSMAESHRVGVFARTDWEGWLAEEGFDVETVQERTDEDRTTRFFFLGTRPREVVS
jgi:SAM-dependent methyltransferase